MDKIFLAAVKRRELIITIFKILYVFLILLTIVGGKAIISRSSSATFFLSVVAYWGGRLAVITYILTLIPGMFRRFGLQHKMVALLMIFRRYIGIAMYCFVFLHYWLMRGVDFFFLHRGVFPGPLYEVLGLFAALIVAAMAFTSNDLSTKKLGIWWNRIHSATYVAVFLIFLHVALVKINIWTIVIGAAVVVQAASFIYPRWKKKQIASPVTSVTNSPSTGEQKTEIIKQPEELPSPK